MLTLVLIYYRQKPVDLNLSDFYWTPHILDVSVVFLSKCTGNLPRIIILSLPSPFFPIRYSLIVLPYNAIWFELLVAPLNKSHN
jgi:hypothetical protein